MHYWNANPTGSHFPVVLLGWLWRVKTTRLAETIFCCAFFALLRSLVVAVFILTFCMMDSIQENVVTPTSPLFNFWNAQLCCLQPFFCNTTTCPCFCPLPTVYCFIAILYLNIFHIPHSFVCIPYQLFRILLQYIPFFLGRVLSVYLDIWVLIFIPSLNHTCWLLFFFLIYESITLELGHFKFIFKCFRWKVHRLSTIKTKEYH